MGLFGELGPNPALYLPYLSPHLILRTVVSEVTLDVLPSLCQPSKSLTEESPLLLFFPPLMNSFHLLEFAYYANQSDLASR